MKSKLPLALPLIFFLAGRLAAQNRTPPAGRPADPFAAADRAIDDLQKIMTDLPKCFKTVAAMKRDLADKKKAITAKYGKIPPSYQPLIIMKSNRLSKQTVQCRALFAGAAFDNAGQILRSVEPKSMPGFDVRRQRIERLRREFNDAVREWSH